MLDAMIRFVVNKEDKIHITNINYTENHYHLLEIDENEYVEFLMKSIKDKTTDSFNLALIKININTHQGIEDYDVNIDFELIENKILKENYQFIKKRELYEAIKYVNFCVNREDLTEEKILNFIGCELEEYEEYYGILIEDFDSLIVAMCNDTLTDLDIFKEISKTILDISFYKKG